MEWSEFFKYYLMAVLALGTLGVTIVVVYESMLDSKVKKDVEREDLLRKGHFK